MKKAAYSAYLTVLLGLLLIPEYAFGQGLVPECTRGDNQMLNPCQFCDVVVLVNNVVSWLVTILGIIGTIVIVYAGVLLVVSGGNASAKEKAKEYITNILIGYVIILAGWLLIDTALKALLSDQNYGVWNEIKCVDQPKAVAADKRIINLGDVGVSAGRYSLEQEVEGQFGENSGVGSLGSCQKAATGPCSESALRANGFGDLAGAAAQIVGAESGCGSNAESRTDTTSDGRTYSVGTWQINLASNNIQCITNDGRQINLNCKSAFREAGYRNKYKVRVQEVINEDLYKDCLEAAKIPECNNQMAANLARNSGDMGDWACSAKKCGVRTSRNHKCPL